MSLDLSVPIRAAIVAESTITDYLSEYKGSYPVFTKVPTPDDADDYMPLIVVSAQLQSAEDDGLADQRPSIVRDLLVYGTNGRDDTNDQYREVEAVAFALREMFHRQRGSLTVPGWVVTDVLATGPSPAPVDDEQTVGRRVELTVRLARAD